MLLKRPAVGAIIENPMGVQDKCWHYIKYAFRRKTG